MAIGQTIDRLDSLHQAKIAEGAVHKLHRQLVGRGGVSQLSTSRGGVYSVYVVCEWPLTNVLSECKVFEPRVSRL